jgi:hypothetical protein
MNQAVWLSHTRAMLNVRGLSRSGRTTALAYLYIGAAMAHPEESVEVIDHAALTRLSNQHLADQIHNIIDQQHLRGFQLVRAENCVLLEFNPKAIMPDESQKELYANDR